jgi:hypothetical protein
MAQPHPQSPCRGGDLARRFTHSGYAYPDDDTRTKSGNRQKHLLRSIYAPAEFADGPARHGPECLLSNFMYGLLSLTADVFRVPRHRGGNLADERDSGRELRASLDRLTGETGRMRRMVEQPLRLARFDTEPPARHSESVTLAAVAAVAAERCQVVGGRRSLLSDCPRLPNSPRRRVAVNRREGGVSSDRRGVRRDRARCGVIPVAHAFHALA